MAKSENTPGTAAGTKTGRSAATDKIIRKYLRCYEDETAPLRYMCPPSEKAYLDFHTKRYQEKYYAFDLPYDAQRAAKIQLPENYKNLLPREQVVRSIMLETYCVRTPYFLQLYQALPVGDWEAVNDAEYQHAKHRLVHECASGFYYDPRPILGALAANDFSGLDCNAPDAFSGHDRGWLPWAATGNLLLGLYHHDTPTIEEGLAQCQRLQTLRSYSNTFKALARYMAALAEHEIPQASEALDEFCVGYNRMPSWLHGVPIEKCFCSPAHGLYNFARKILSPEEFARLEMPTHGSFIREFALWQQEQGCPSGKIAFVYPEKFRLMNEALQLPVSALRNIPDKEAKEEAVAQAWIDLFGYELDWETLADAASSC